jgi:DNA modification methylase
MSLYYADDSVTLHLGDALEVLSTMDAGSVDCIVTSPPYYGLRDYGVDGQIGLERTPAEFVERLRAVFAEARRVLADHGTCWVNIGDSYASKPAGDGSSGRRDRRGAGLLDKRGDRPEKNLLGIPWRLAFALQDDGWILRNAVVWAKPNAMPSPVTDRFSTTYELVFLLTKRPRYWFDLDVIREPLLRPEARDGTRVFGGKNKGAKGGVGASARLRGKNTYGGAGPSGRNPGDVWTIATRPYPGAHYATFPVDLPLRCITAGCPSEVCTVCGEPRRRIQARGRDLDPSRPQARRAMELAEQHGLTDEHIAAIRATGITDAGKARHTQTGTDRNADRVRALADEAKTALGGYFREFLLAPLTTTGWTDCGHGAYRPGVVLDPFSGTGTTGLAARSLGRRYVGIDLDPGSHNQAIDRFAQGVLTDGGAA